MKPLPLFAAALLFVGLSACNKSPGTQTGAVDADAANGNLAPADQSAAPSPQSTDAAPPTGEVADDSSAQPLEAPDPPPPLPDYSQPPCPGDDYIWTPGYWDYASSGYYWVPGAWVMAPYVGALWTPPWWGFSNGAYVWHAGYWGPHIGFYGGVNYGFGYTGRGYYGAYWNNGRVFYNRSVTNVNESVVHNVYNYSAPAAHGGRVSYNGGRGGIDVRPTAQESAALRDRRTAPVAAQVQHAREASTNREQFHAGERSQPTTLAAPHPLATENRAPADRAPERAPETRPAERPAPASAERARQQPTARPEPAARPAQPEPHADRMARPEAPPRPAPQQHAAPEEHRAPEQHAAPESHPAPQQHAAPHQAPPPNEKRKGG